MSVVGTAKATRALIGRCPLRGRIALGVVAVIAALSSFIYLYFPAQLERQAVEGLANRARSMARVTAYTVAPALDFGDVLAAHESL
ncbi:MAG: hypothetical protein OER90_15300, partial [Gemmatimonadota bacterium]|nr:hypothetical protein [Gemmatimonadota bacterium]